MTIITCKWRLHWIIFQLFFTRFASSRSFWFKNKCIHIYIKTCVITSNETLHTIN
uniref:Uncharacterized protein n=1 Tax=Tetranychus urticae TaxID=32264 RepID=T1KE78_TETUR